MSLDPTVWAEWCKQVEYLISRKPNPVKVAIWPSLSGTKDAVEITTVSLHPEHGWSLWGKGICFTADSFHDMNEVLRRTCVDLNMIRREVDPSIPFGDSDLILKELRDRNTPYRGPNLNGFETEDCKPQEPWPLRKWWELGRVKDVRGRKARDMTSEERSEAAADLLKMSESLVPKETREGEDWIRHRALRERGISVPILEEGEERSFIHRANRFSNRKDRLVEALHHLGPYMRGNRNPPTEGFTLCIPHPNQKTGESVSFASVPLSEMVDLLAREAMEVIKEAEALHTGIDQTIFQFLESHVWTDKTTILNEGT